MTLSLQKGQKISLSKEAGGTLNRITVGLGWDPTRAGVDIDLDASAIMFSEAKQVVDKVYFGEKTSTDGSVQHSGDNLTGEGEGDDEQIVVNLSAVSANVKHISFVVTSYSGQTFNEIANAFCRVVDNATGRELARYELSTSGGYRGMVIARVYRHNNEWKMAALGEYSNQGKTVNDMLELAARCL
jgi:tellurium resistance protein TerZ